jgi:cellulase
MHFGPALAYLGEFPSADTKPQDVNFFKIFEQGYDSAKGQHLLQKLPDKPSTDTSLGKWANEIASDNGDSYKVQIPSDIKSGTYVLRTEIIALHGNAKQLQGGPLAGPQFYTYCFNVDVINGGNAQPEGVKFPGAYTKEALRTPIYLPARGDSAEVVANGNALNGRYVSNLHFV